MTQACHSDEEGASGGVRVGAGGRRVTGAVRAALAATLVVAVVLVMVRLSIWQWDKARAHGALLNYTYAVEWLVFAGLTVVGVVRLALEARRQVGETAEPAPGTARADASVPPAGPVPLIGPPLAPGEELEEITWVRLRRRLGLDGRSAT